MITSAICTRSNYFEVTDETAFHSIINDVCMRGSGHTLDVLTRVDDDNITKYAITAATSILGINIGNDEKPDYDFSEFVKRLQSVVSPDDAIIIYSMGYDLPYYADSKCDIITSTTWTSESLLTFAEKKARTCLNNPNWTTKFR